MQIAKKDAIRDQIYKIRRDMAGINPSLSTYRKLEARVAELELMLASDDSTTTVYVPTPRRWKCQRIGCPTPFKHSHSTYSGLINKK